MADKDMTAIREVQIVNDANGPRFVNTTEGQLVIPAGATSEVVSMREGELADLPDGLRESTAAPQPHGSEEGGESDREDGPENFQWPDDLASTTSADGLIPRKDLVAIAKAEEVEHESDANKPTLAGLIVAARRAKAEAGQ